MIKKLALAALLALVPAAALAQGPGPGPQPSPSPWQQNGATLSYDQGGVALPSTVTGGSKGAGSLNATGLYVGGVAVNAAGIVTLSFAMPSIFSVTGSPASGANPSITVALGTEAANVVLAGPSTGSPAAPTFRSLVPADLPTMTSTVGGAVPTPPNDATKFLDGAGAFVVPSGSASENPTATAGPTAVNGSASTFMRSDAAPAVQTATSSQKGLVQPDGTSITISAGTIIDLSSPKGRLTLSTGKPVMQGDVVAATTIFYDSYVSNLAPVNGAVLTIPGNEVSMGLAAANVISGSLYDVFAVNNAGALAICAGPAWTNATTRSAAVALNNGVWTNGVSLTNCFGGAAGTTNFGTVAANAGTYLGTFFATANGQTSVQFKAAAAAGGSSPIIGVWNAYNQVRVTSLDQDSTASWSYATNAWRHSDGSTSNRVRYVDGLGLSPVAARFAQVITGNSGSVIAMIGVERDWTSGIPSGKVGATQNSALPTDAFAENAWAPALGLHEIDAMETPNSALAALYYGQQSSVEWYALTVEVGM